MVYQVVGLYLVDSVFNYHWLCCFCMSSSIVLWYQSLSPNSNYLLYALLVVKKKVILTDLCKALPVNMWRVLLKFILLIFDARWLYLCLIYLLIDRFKLNWRSSFLTLRWWLAQLLHLNVQTCGVTLHSYLLHAIWIKILVIQRGLRLLLIQFSFLLVNRLRLFLVNLKYLNYCLSNQASVPGISAPESLTDLRNHVGLLLLFSYLVKYTQCDVLLAKKAPWNCFCDVLKMTSID